MAELGIGHSSPHVGDPALTAPLPASRKPALHGNQEFWANLSSTGLHISLHPVVCCFSSAGCQSTRLRSRSLRPHLSADGALTERRPSAEGPRWRIVRRRYPRLGSRSRSLSLRLHLGVDRESNLRRPSVGRAPRRRGAAVAEPSHLHGQ